MDSQQDAAVKKMLHMRHMLRSFDKDIIRAINTMERGEEYFDFPSLASNITGVVVRGCIDSCRDYIEWYALKQEKGNG